MKILVHDYAGHPFPLQLSRELAGRGHDVCHAYCASLKTTPQAGMKVFESNLEVHGIDLGRPLKKFSFVRRWQQERLYGRLAAKVASEFDPDVVLSANTPLDAQRALLRSCRENDIKFVVWLQDVISVATDRVLRARIPLLGPPVGAHYLRLERSILRQSDFIVPITEDFIPLLSEWGIPPERVEAIENWAVLEEAPVRPRKNEWSTAHGLDDSFCFLYSGTLGLKHNPQLLLALAERFIDSDNVMVVVVSQGLGADWLRKKLRERGTANLKILDFQPYEMLPDVLATADVLLAILEPDAGTYSVPSKVLTYVCARRPLLLAVPEDNLAARIVTRQQAGLVVPPADEAAWLQAADRLCRDAPLRELLGRNARRYAEEAFDINRIADRFEGVLTALMK